MCILIMLLIIAKLLKGGGFKDKIADFCRSYFANSNLHGLRYLVDEKYNNKLVSACWSFLLLTSFGFCFYLIFLQLNRFEETAIMNSIVSTGYPVWKNPFPAVIICNNNVVYKDRAKNIVKTLVAKGIGEEAVTEFLKNLSKMILCRDCVEKEQYFNISKQIEIEMILTHLGYSTDKLFKELAHPCNNMLKKCMWKSEEIACNSLFKLTKTTMGYCCAFNYFGTAKLQHHFDQAVFSGGFGVNSGLQVVIDIEPHQYMSTANNIPAIMIRNALQFAEFSSQSNSLAAGRSLSIGVDPNTYKSTGDLKYLEDVRRGCWFYNEGNLKWTKFYDYLTCFNECKANHILQVCNCKPFYYEQGDTERTCTFKDLSCLVHNKTIFYSLMLTGNVKDIDYAHIDNITQARFCYCLPNCDDVHYILQKNEKLSSNLKNSTCGLNVHFNNIAGILRLRTVNVTWDTRLAIIGGLFGLCMGGSVISLFELVFFLLQTILRHFSPNINIINNKGVDNFIL